MKEKKVLKLSLNKKTIAHLEMDSAKGGRPAGTLGAYYTACGCLTLAANYTDCGCITLCQHLTECGC
ncbi:MAG: hypothetical protein GY757_27605 [bacterium]|nr:hypothetical protein [bacterium]